MNLISVFGPARSLWELVDFWASIAVFVGVAVELIEEFEFLAKLVWLDRLPRLRLSVKHAGLVILIAALAVESWAGGQVRKIDNAITASLQAKLSEQIRSAQITEERLLGERRLTSRERVETRFLWRAVLPRVDFFDPAKFETVVRASGYKRIDVASIQKPEPLMLTMALMQALSVAKVGGELILLPPDSNVSGLQVASPNPMHDRLGQMLWQQMQLGGGGTSLAFQKTLIPQLAKLSDTDVVLLVGDNDAFMQGLPGQDGEGIDRYGGPVPPP